jgi:hypothetical protein
MAISPLNFFWLADPHDLQDIPPSLNVTGLLTAVTCAAAYPHFADFHALILGLPLVERCRADARSPAQIFDRCSTLRFPQHRDDLLFAESTPLHTPSPLTVL